MTEGKKIVGVRVQGMAYDYDESAYEENDIPDFYSVYLILEDGTLDHYDDHDDRTAAVQQGDAICEDLDVDIDIAWYKF